MFHLKFQQIAMACVVLLVAACGAAPAAPTAQTQPIATTIPPTAAPAQTAPAQPAAATAPPTTAPQQGAQTSEIWFYYPKPALEPTDFVQRSVDAFNQAHPSIKVNLVFFDFNSGDPIADQPHQSQGANGKPVSIEASFDSEVGRYTQEHDILPVDDCIAQNGGSNLLSDFYPPFLSTVQTAGKIWGIPWSGALTVLFYNKEAFQEAGLNPEQPPKTWDELEADAVKLTQRNGDNTVKRWGAEIPLNPWLFQGFAFTNGHRLGIDTTHVNLNAPAAVETLQFWANLANKDRVMPNTGLNDDTATNDFWGGKAAMLVEGSGALRLVQKAAKFSVGVAALPARKQAGGAVSAGTLFLSRQMTPAQSAVACQFMAYFTAPEQVVNAVADTLYLPARKSVYDSPAMKPILANAPQLLAERDALQQADGFLKLVDYRPLGGLFQALNQALKGDKAPQEALDQAQKAADDGLAQYR